MARTSGPNEGNRLIGELVTSPQRREVVRHLTENGGEARFDDLVDLFAMEADPTMTAVRLHHVHLPKLQAAGAVEWDDDTGEVRLTTDARATVVEAERKLFNRPADD